MGTKPAGNLVLIIVNSGMALFILLFFSIRFKTRITDSFVSFRFIPFQIKARIIEWKDIKSIEVSKFDAIRDYWGFGLRYMPGKGWCHTISGGDGIKITLNNEKKILLRTHKAKEISQILDNLRNKGFIT